MHVLRGVAVQPDRSRARSPRDARADRCPMLQARASHAHTRDTTRIAADSATTRARFSHTRTARRRLHHRLDTPPCWPTTCCLTSRARLHVYG